MVAGQRFVDPIYPFGWVEPAVAELDEVAGGLGDDDGPRVGGVAGGGDVGRQAFGHGEGVEGGGGRVTPMVIQAVAQGS